MACEPLPVSLDSSARPMVASLEELRSNGLPAGMMPGLPVGATRHVRQCTFRHATARVNYNSGRSVGPQESNMSVSAVSSGPSLPVAPPPSTPLPPSAPAAVTTKTAIVARAADGDYKVRSAQTSQVKDSDGDFKALAAAKAPSTQSSSGVQSALASLKKGG